LILWSFIGSVVLNIASSVAFAQTANYVRVVILSDAQTLSLKINGPYEITASSGEPLDRGRILITTVSTYKGGISLAGNFFKATRITIKVNDPDVITINDRMFRGQIQLVRNKDMTLTVINRVELEDYVKGILYHEASHYWPIEALKAQAIACRTYAIYQVQENKEKSFDVTSDIYSQIYGGKTSERYRTSKAVDETKGRILTYQGKVFPAYYSATCAGYTEDASMLWNINMVPLKGVVCAFCKDSPHFNWHYVLSLNEIEEKLSRAFPRISKIKNIVIFNRDKSGRIIDLKIITPNKELKIPAKDFRNIIGPNIIRSTNFKVNVVQADAVFEGVGWGHGVGLCQWGAYFMAKQGRSAEEILKYYYPNTDVETIGF